MALSKELQAAVVRMTRAGRPPSAICAAFHLTKGQVSGIIWRARQDGAVKPTNNPSPKRNAWGEAEIATVKRLYGEGLSGSQIAAEMGVKSRMAVIGIIHRLRAKGEITVRRVRKTESRQWYGYTPQPHEHVTQGPAPRADDIPRVTFADLEQHHCRFICCAEANKAVAAGDKLYCGLQRAPGSFYCEGHLARVSPAATVLTPKRQAYLEGEKLSARFAPEPMEEMPA